MSNFVYDALGLPFPKTNARPLRVPAGQGVVAADWNLICQSLIDVRGVLLGARYYGIAQLSGDPTPAGVTNYFWLAPNGELFLHVGSNTKIIPSVVPGAKGDLLVYSGAASYGALGVGADGKVLKANSAATLGVSWGDAGGFGQSGQSMISIVPGGARASHDGSTPLVIGAFAFDPTAYQITGTTRSLVFRALVASGGGVKTVHVKLRNLTDNEDVTGADLTTTAVATTKLEATLTEGTVAGAIKPSEKIYEVRIWVDAPAVPTDTVELYGAQLRVVSTIQ